MVKIDNSRISNNINIMTLIMANCKLHFISVIYIQIRLAALNHIIV